MELVQASPFPERRGELPPVPLPVGFVDAVLMEVEVEGTFIPEVEGTGIAATLAPDHLEDRS